MLLSINFWKACITFCLDWVDAFFFNEEIKPFLKKFKKKSLMKYVMLTRSNKSTLTVVYTLGMFEKGKEKKNNSCISSIELREKKSDTLMGLKSFWSRIWILSNTIIMQMRVHKGVNPIMIAFIYLLSITSLLKLSVPEIELA